MLVSMTHTLMYMNPAYIFVASSSSSRMLRARRASATRAICDSEGHIVSGGHSSVTAEYASASASVRHGTALRRSISRVYSSRGILFVGTSSYMPPIRYGSGCSLRNTAARSRLGGHQKSTLLTMSKPSDSSAPGTVSWHPSGKDRCTIRIASGSSIRRKIMPRSCGSTYSMPSIVFTTTSLPTLGVPANRRSATSGRRLMTPCGGGRGWVMCLTSTFPYIRSADARNPHNGRRSCTPGA